MSLKLRLAGIAALVAFVALLAALNVLSARNRVKKIPADHPDAGRPEAHAAAEATTPHGGPMPPGIVTLFNDLGAAFQDRAGAGAGARRFFDMGRMVGQCDADGSFSPAQRDEFAEGLAAGLDPALADLSKAVKWDRVEIRSLRWYVEGRDGVVVTRHTDSDTEGGDKATKWRWWVALRDGGWWVYDYENMASGGRLTVLVGAMLKLHVAKKMGPGEAAQLGEFRGRFRDIRTAMALKDYAAAGQLSADPPPAFLPGALQSQFFLWKALAALGQHKPDAALAALRQAETLDPAATGIWLPRALALSRLGRHAEAVDAAEKHLAEYGPDAAVYFQLAADYAALKRPSETREAFRKGFDEAPNSPDMLNDFRRVLPPAEKKEVGERFAKLATPHKHFDRLHKESLADGDREGAAELEKAFRKLTPGKP